MARPRPEERVLRTRSALRAFTEDDIRQPLRVVPVIRYGQPGRLFSDERQAGAAAEPGGISTRGDDLTLDQAAQRVLARMEAQRTSLQEQFNNRYLFISAGKSPGRERCCWALFYYGAFPRLAAGATLFPAADPRKRQRHTAALAALSRQY